MLNGAGCNESNVVEKSGMASVKEAEAELDKDLQMRVNRLNVGRLDVESNLGEKMLIK